MGSVKASIRIWVQDSGWWYPPFEDRSKLLPLLPRALTAANQYVTPQSIDAISEDAQLIDVAGDGMVLVVAGDHVRNAEEVHHDLTGFGKTQVVHQPCYQRTQGDNKNSPRVSAILDPATCDGEPRGPGRG